MNNELTDEQLVKAWIDAGFDCWSYEKTAIKCARAIIQADRAQRQAATQLPGTPVIEQARQEPFGYIMPGSYAYELRVLTSRTSEHYTQPLYTAPQPAQVPLDNDTLRSMESKK